MAQPAAPLETTRGGTPELASKYDPASVEGETYQRWLDLGVFETDPASDRPTFAIVIPPPNVTGSLHLGHALGHTIMDALTRRKRMQGYDALWLPGMDHAGIATQNVVERELGKEGLSRHDLGREAFIERVWQWKEEYGGKILGQMRRLGDGLDWGRERFTMDEGLSRAVRTVFKRLHDDGLIYRAERIINWCPRCMTALSDIEVDHRDTDGELVSISYGPLTVATTRAETMLGDTAVAVHPDDERYAGLIGQQVVLPIVGRRLTIIADDYVRTDFGTGVLKITPGHDPNDFEIGRRHGLDEIGVIGEDGLMTAEAGERYEGLTVAQARERIVADLDVLGLIRAREEHVHSVPFSQRSGERIEPLISLQWFMRMDELAAPAIEAVTSGRVRIHPASQSRRYV
ncbi:MAG: valyl-tRNA synthetase, partial [Frankiaceae bacterium]|nr:valyl-tRNA synthetase [Frankiaceae bacterium]